MFQRLQRQHHLCNHLTFGRWPSKPNTVRRRNWRSEKLPSLNTWIRYLSQYGGERGLFLLRRTVLGLSRAAQPLAYLGLSRRKPWDSNPQAAMTPPPAFKTGP